MKQTIKKALALGTALVLLLGCVPAMGATETTGIKYGMTINVTSDKISLNANSITLMERDTVAFSAAVAEGIDPALSFASKKESVAYVDEAGVLHATKKGSTTITVKNSYGKKATLKVKVTEWQEPDFLKESLKEIPDRIAITLALRNKSRARIDMPMLEGSDALNRAAYYCLVQIINNDPNYWTYWNNGKYSASGFHVPTETIQQYLDDFGVSGTVLGCVITVRTPGRASSKFGPFGSIGVVGGAPFPSKPFSWTLEEAAYEGMALIGLGEFEDTTVLNRNIYGEHTIFLTMADDYTFKRTSLSKKWKTNYSYAETMEDIPS